MTLGYSHIISKYMYIITLFIKYNGPQNNSVGIMATRNEHARSNEMITFY